MFLTLFCFFLLVGVWGVGGFFLAHIFALCAEVTLFPGATNSPSQSY